MRVMRKNLIKLAVEEGCTITKAPHKTIIKRSEGRAVTFWEDGSLTRNDVMLHQQEDMTVQAAARFLRIV